ncbi:MAG TPA: BatA domain-containing protein [Candidatus Acidoferrum sp.]|nr:BatA domain-containing protein [Candidatus Acidoferrum sp.]
MQFLQPILLWGLPLVLLPVIIHFLNRLRHRSHPWAAMRFLVAATRSSISNTKLRQLLILLFRMGMVAALCLTLARPLAGGWMGWAVSSAPDAIVILLDRSASMEIKNAALSKREQAIRLLSQAAGQFEESSHLVLIDSASLLPAEAGRATNLMRLPATAPSDTAADLPAMLRAAFNWLLENHAGAAEIWIASDAQRSNWHPEDPRWKDLASQLGSLPQKVRIRLLVLSQPADANTSISLKEVARRSHGANSELQFVLDLQRNQPANASIPITLTLDGSQTQTPLAFDGQSLRWRRRVDLGAHPAGGWGSFSLPADANARDNTAYFVYGAETPLRGLVVSRSPDTARYLQLAAASRDGRPAALLAPADFPAANLDGCSLLLWQDDLPDGEAAARVQSFVANGGVAAFFPPGRADPGQFNALGWGAVESSETAARFHVLRWNEDEGPLARSDERISLPLGQTVFARRQIIAGQKNVLAAFADGAALLVRQSLGRGEFYFCSSLPADDWSSLADGPVLVPMLQRLLQDGVRRLQSVSTSVCGELTAAELAQTWVCVDSSEPKDIRFQAGVYKSGDHLMAVNRPPAEDDPEVMDSGDLRKLFGDLPLQMLQDRRVETGQLQGEIWRLFLFLMLLLLLGEGLLILPAKRPVAAPGTRALKTYRQPEEQTVP